MMETKSNPKAYRIKTIFSFSLQATIYIILDFEINIYLYCLLAIVNLIKDF